MSAQHCVVKPGRGSARARNLVVPVILELVFFVGRDGHWKQSGLETEPTEWNEASYGPLLSAWQMTCGSVPSHTALPEGLGFDEMLWIYRKVLEESKQP